MRVYSPPRTGRAILVPPTTDANAERKVTRNAGGCGCAMGAQGKGCFQEPKSSEEPAVNSHQPKYAPFQRRIWVSSPNEPKGAMRER
jgi:hypothetical protein